MYYISDYKKRAIDKITPYLIEFPEIVKIIEMSSDRYQAIENVIWQIANNFRIDEATGEFLNIHAHNEVSEIVYADKVDDAFTYGTDNPSKQAYGTGHYYSRVSYLSGSQKGISDDKMRRAIKAKIIQNNTDGTIEDLIEGLKLYFNLDRVGIAESYPLAVTITLEGKDIELNISDNDKVIKNFLPACVALKYLYLNDKSYNIYKLGQETSYGLSRNPIDISEVVSKYTPLYQCINMYSEYNEYIKTKHNSLTDKMFCCFSGRIIDIYSNNYLFSTKNSNNSLSLSINSQNYFEVNHNGTVYNIDILAEENKEYTFILYNSNGKLKVFAYKGIKYSGEDLDKDSAELANNILYQEPNITIDNYTTIENATIYINGIQNGENVVCGDFTYYSIIFGNIDEEQIINDITEYYVTSYGQKSLLFNCVSNTNHLNINSTYVPTPSTHREIVSLQSSFKYDKNHANSKYAYFSGNANIQYNYTESLQVVDNAYLSLSICTPIELQESLLVSNFIGGDSEIHITNSNGIVANIQVYNTSTQSVEQFIVTTPDNVLYNNMFNNIEIKYTNNVLSIYNNNEIIAEETLSSNLQIKSVKQINIGNMSFNGLLKNIKYNVNTDDLQLNLDVPCMYTLRDDINNIYYTNEGVRLITTPQLMNDITNLDLYGNKLIGVR